MLSPLVLGSCITLVCCSCSRSIFEAAQQRVIKAVSSLTMNGCGEQYNPVRCHWFAIQPNTSPVSISTRYLVVS